MINGDKDERVEEEQQLTCFLAWRLCRQSVISQPGCDWLTVAVFIGWPLTSLHFVCTSPTRLLAENGEFPGEGGELYRDRLCETFSPSTKDTRQAAGSDVLR